MRTHTKETSNSVLLALCERNSPVAGEFHTQRASNAEKVPFDDVIMLFSFVFHLCPGSCCEFCIFSVYSDMNNYHMQRDFVLFVNWGS